MTNHVHLLVTPRDEDSLPRMMQSLGRRYVRHVNSVYRRSGTLWDGRYRAAPINSEAYFLACCRYIELNPVRAGMVDRPRAYRWSSYRADADGAADALLSEHAIYRALGRGGEARRKEYRASPLVAAILVWATRRQLRRAATDRIGDLLREARVAERPAAIRRRSQRRDEFAVERAAEQKLL